MMAGLTVHTLHPRLRGSPVRVEGRLLMFPRR
jgi:hypothetical protein